MFSGALLYSFASWLSPSGSMGNACAHGGHVITYLRCSVWKPLDHPCSLDRRRLLNSPDFILRPCCRIDIRKLVSEYKKSMRFNDILYYYDLVMILLEEKVG